MVTILGGLSTQSEARKNSTRYKFLLERLLLKTRDTFCFSKDILSIGAKIGAILRSFVFRRQEAARRRCGVSHNAILQNGVQSLGT